MQSQLQAAINQVCAEKNIDKDVVIQAIENGIALAYKKDFGRIGQNIKVTLGEDITDTKIFEEREIVKKIEDHDKHISLKDAKNIRPDAEEGQIVYVPLKLEQDFGRIAAQTAKQVMTQQMQEAEKNMLYDKFSGRIGELLTARVQKYDKDMCLIEIEGVTTILNRYGQIPGEKYFTGQRMKVLLEDVVQTSRGPQLRITRSTREFVEALFRAEIPEMRENLVYIARISRDPGVRCKIAVASEDAQGVDPVGAFVGQRGTRINVVMEELGDERIDIIQYYEDKKKFLLAALSPAKVSKVEFFDGEKGEARVKIFVRDEERAMCIGKRGQNVRLAGKLLELQIDVLTYEGPAEEDEASVPQKKVEKRRISDAMTIDRLEGVNAEVIAKLTELGLSQIKQFDGLKAEELAEVGISLVDAKTVMKAIEKYISGK